MEEFFSRLNRFFKNYGRFFLMALLIAAAIIAVRVFPYALALMSPFVIAWILAVLASPLVRFLKKRLHLPSPIGAALAMLVILALAVFLTILAVSGVTRLSDSVIENWEDICDSVQTYAESLVTRVESLAASWSYEIPDEVQTYVDGIIANTGTSGGMLKDVLGWALPAFGNVAGGTIRFLISLPGAILYAVILLLATYVFTARRDTFKERFMNAVSDKTAKTLRLIKKEGIGALWGYFRAHLILTAITGVELYIGFLILGVKSAPLLAVLVAIVDFLPVFGTGTILIPWAIINLLVGGSVYFSLGMIALYLICLCVRNLLQPRILSESIGLPPIATLLTIWLGYQLYGFWGMLFLPILAMLVYRMYEIGLFDWFFLSHRAVTEENAAKAAAKAAAKKPGKGKTA